MLGNFTFHNPTKLYFGENSLENLGKELGCLLYTSPSPRRKSNAGVRRRVYP